MTGNGNRCATVPLGWKEPVIEQADMLITMSLQPDGAVSCFDKCPLEIVVDAAAGASMADMASAGNDAGHEPCIAGQVFSSGEPLDIADFQPNQWGKNGPQTRHRAQKPGLLACFELHFDASLDCRDLLFELIDGVQLCVFGKPA